MLQEFPGCSQRLTKTASKGNGIISLVMQFTCGDGDEVAMRMAWVPEFVAEYEANYVRMDGGRQEREAIRMESRRHRSIRVVEGPRGWSSTSRHKGFARSASCDVGHCKRNQARRDNTKTSTCSDAATQFE